MENINDNDPTPESDDEANNTDSIADETLDLGVSDEIPEPDVDGAVENTADSDVERENDVGGFTIDSDSDADADELEMDVADDDIDDIDIDDIEAEAETDILAAAAELENDDHWGDSLSGDSTHAGDTTEVPQDAPVSDGQFTAGAADDTFDGAARPNEPTQTIPPPPQVAASTRLTRDPYATFGGVLSGIAHNYGWDVALTRLAFIVTLLVTGGTALIAYVLAWVLIPRATHWPPATTHRRGLSSFSGRDLGIGLVALGALVVLGISSGEAAGVLVPLALVGGGIWLLVQNPRSASTPQMAAPQMATAAMTTQNMGAPMNAAYAGSTPMAGGATPPPMQPVPPNNYYGQPAAPQPAPKRSRLRRVAIVGGIGFLGLMLLAVVAVPLIVIGAIASGEADFEFNSDPIIYSPDTIAEIPSLIDQDGGEIFIDLRNVDFTDLADDADPITLEVNLDAGEIRVAVPEDVRVTLDAETDFVGELDIFGSQTDGISPEVSLDSDDPQLILDLEVNAGRIEVTREAAQ